MTSFILALTLTAAGFAAAGDPLATAKDLYATAAYEDALRVLVDARATAAKNDVLQLDQYRVFCLFALGRKADAQAVVESIVRVDPLFQPDDDASPAIHALFVSVRKQTLPAVIREKYRAGKAAIDKKDFKGAEPVLNDVLRLIGELTAIGGSDESITDLGMIADGFLTIGRAAASPAPVEAAENGASQTDASAQRAAAANMQQPKPPSVARYNSESPGVTPPVPIAQGLPPVPPEIARFGSDKRGVIEVTIESTGRVESVIVRESLNPSYDRLAVEAAKRWQFKPAVKDGQPVRFVKLVAITLKP